MNMLGRLAGIFTLLGVVLPPATPAAAVVHARTCEKYGGTTTSSWYGVNICIKLEYLPGGVRALLAFDCFYVVPNPYREVDTACNYELKELFVWDNYNEVVRSPLEYGHITNKGYHQFATPWYRCNENRTTDYLAVVGNANVRFPNGQLYEKWDLLSDPSRGSRARDGSGGVRVGPAGRARIPSHTVVDERPRANDRRRSSAAWAANR